MKEKNNESVFKSGFIALIGRPSSGKSSLINAICGYKISIVSKHPQTTQSVIKGIYNDDNCQIIFLDTPGYHIFNSNINKGLSNLAVRTIQDADMILYLVDITREFGKEEEEIINILKKTGKKIITVFNKIDLSDLVKKDLKKEILTRLKPYAALDVSAIKITNIDKLINEIKNNLPEGQLYYPEDYITDQSIPFRIKETIREKIFNNTKNELPYSVYIDIESLEVNEKKIIANAVIYVEKDSQKIIIVGKKGEMIKKIGEQARLELIDIFDRKVNLFLFVKVHFNWKKNEKFLKKIFEIE